jgi:muramoyltetrapeptide carboxypeptidase LdcA involved in peptidoglycan recycling
MSFEKIAFIAPSTCLPRGARPRLRKTANLLRQALGVKDIYFSPHLFSSDEEIGHVSAPVEERAEVFKKAVREFDLIASVAGGTGAEDILRRIDRKDYRIIRERRPLFIGFSDFTFLLNEIYYRSRVPAVYFPSLRLGRSNIKKIYALITGEEIRYRGQMWLTPPPPRKLSGIPIGGNLSTFVNFLNRVKPPRFSWRRHVLFIEDVQVDVEDLHRMLAALRRHNVFKGIKGIVVGSVSHTTKNSHARRQQKEALRFIRTYLGDVIRERRKQGFPLPILAVSNFGHDIQRDLMAVPIGGKVTISKGKVITFWIRRRPAKNGLAA